VIRSPRAILALLTLLNFINYLDRFLVSAVAPKIQQSLHLTNVQIGWVTSAFLVGYMFTSPAFGWLGDRYPRKALIAGGIAIWSLATVASGLARSFPQMLAARIVVGVGEASYAALAPTIIDDISPKERKSANLAIFYMATPIGSALGFVLGGQLDRLYGWEKAFFIAGGPGLALALLTLWLSEPPRAREGGDSKVDARTAYQALARRPLYVLAVVGYIGQTFALGGFTNWAPQYLSRRHCMEVHEADFWFGVITVVTGFLGTGLGGWLADRMSGDRVTVCLRLCAISSIIASPIAAAALLMPTGSTFFVCMALCELAIFVSVSPINAAILHSVPTAVRASAMAVSIFAIHALGDAISPPLLGLVADVFRDQPEKCSGGAGLQLGMFLLPVALVVSAIGWGRGAWRRPAEGAA
jgi:MFS family permease